MTPPAASAPSPTVEEAMALAQRILAGGAPCSWNTGDSRRAFETIASALAARERELEEARARADKAERNEREYHRQIEKLTSGCPWEGPASEMEKYQPSDPCPVCGDTGETNNDEPPRCVAYASGRQNTVISSLQVENATLRASVERMKAGK